MHLSALGLGAELLALAEPRQCTGLLHDWEPFAHPHQIEPPGDWTTWLLLGGRGAGKTRAGAEWVKALALREGSRCSPIALIGETEHDAREVMVEGVSGLLRVHGSASKAAMVSLAPPAGMAERRGGPGVFRRGPGEFARAAVRGRVVR